MKADREAAFLSAFAANVKRGLKARQPGLPILSPLNTPEVIPFMMRIGLFLAGLARYPSTLGICIAEFA